MKNSIIIRLENTLFNTSKVSDHLPVAKDKERYLNTALPKCPLNPAFGELLVLLTALKSKGIPVSLSILTGFKGEPLWKLLSANGLAGAGVFHSIEKALGETGGKPVLISCVPQDIQAAETTGVESYSDISTSRAVLGAIGVRKSVPEGACRAA